MIESDSILPVLVPRTLLLLAHPAPFSVECGAWSPSASTVVPGPQGGPNRNYLALGSAQRALLPSPPVFRIR